jgi:hypothetical protein
MDFSRRSTRPSFMRILTALLLTFFLIMLAAESQAMVTGF